MFTSLIPSTASNEKAVGVWEQSYFYMQSVHLDSVLLKFEE